MEPRPTRHTHVAAQDRRAATPGETTNSAPETGVTNESGDPRWAEAGERYHVRSPESPHEREPPARWKPEPRREQRREPRRETRWETRRERPEPRRERSTGPAGKERREADVTCFKCKEPGPPPPLAGARRHPPPPHPRSRWWLLVLALFAARDGRVRFSNVTRATPNRVGPALQQQ